MRAATGRSAIGVDIGGTHVRVARISAEGDILTRTSARTSRDPAVLLDWLAATIGDLADGSVAGVGIGVPGRVDSLAGLVLSGGYVDLSRVPLRAALERSLDLPVVVDNDCNMALLGEAARGAAEGVGNVVMLTLGTGIGGALMQDGAIVRGRRCAGQLGHVVVDPAGEPCKCGRLGCLETTSSGTAFGRIAARHGLAAGTTIESIIEAADRREPKSVAVLEEWGLPLCSAIDTLASAFDPDLVLLGGGLGLAGWQVVTRLPRRPSWGEVCPVAAAKLGDDAGVIGAGLAGLRHALSGAARTPAGGAEEAP